MGPLMGSLWTIGGLPASSSYSLFTTLPQPFPSVASKLPLCSACPFSLSGRSQALSCVLFSSHWKLIAGAPGQRDLLSCLCPGPLYPSHQLHRLIQWPAWCWMSQAVCTVLPPHLSHITWPHSRLLCGHSILTHSLVRSKLKRPSRPENHVARLRGWIPMEPSDDSFLRPLCPAIIHEAQKGPLACPGPHMGFDGILFLNPVPRSFLCFSRHPALGSRALWPCACIWLRSQLPEPWGLAERW